MVTIVLNKNLVWIIKRKINRLLFLQLFAPLTFTVLNQSIILRAATLSGRMTWTIDSSKVSRTGMCQFSLQRPFTLYQNLVVQIRTCSKARCRAMKQQQENNYKLRASRVRFRRKNWIYLISIIRNVKTSLFIFLGKRQKVWRWLDSFNADVNWAKRQSYDKLNTRNGHNPRVQTCQPLIMKSLRAW